MSRKYPYESKHSLDTKMAAVMEPEEVAAYLKISKLTLYKLAQKGKIPAFRIGTSWRFSRDVILNLGK